MKFCFLAGAIFLFISCKSDKAQQYVNFLAFTEQKIFRIVAGDSSEYKRLQALIYRKPAIAKSIALSQLDSLREVISDIKKYNINELDSVDRLHVLTLEYYTTYFQYKSLDALEAYLMENSQNISQELKISNMNDADKLTRDRIKMIQKIGLIDQQRNDENLQFREYNRLK